MAQPDFWNDQEKAQKLISENNVLKEKRDSFLKLQKGYEDESTAVELLREEPDPDLQKEIAVEVGVERAAGKRMKFDCATFDKDGFKRLNTKSVKRRSTVQKYGVILDDFFQNVPYLGFHRLHKAFRTLDVMADVAFHKFVHYERLKQLNSHFFGQTALIKFQFRSYDDNGTT